MDPARILLVEDDARLAALLRAVLERADTQVEIAARLGVAEASLEQQPPDLVILDLGLPDGDGLDWLPGLRSRWSGPVLVLTARGDTSDEVAGLELGADDYLRKPVDPERLVARVRALLRRSAASGRALTVGTLQIDATQRAVSVRGESVRLTTGEFDLLWFLASRAGEVVSRDQLYRVLRGVPWDGIDRSIDLRVSRVRKLLGDDPREPRMLKTVRGRGYLLVAA